MSKPSASEIATRMAGECLGFRTRSLSRSITRLYDQALREHGITVAQYGLLAAILGHEPTRPSEISRALNLEKSTLSRNLRVMETNGWVEVGTGESARGQELRLTKNGKKLLRAAFPDWEEAQEDARSFLGGDVVDALLHRKRRG